MYKNVILTLLLLVAVPRATIIHDVYRGAAPTNGANVDVVGGMEGFNISYMETTIDSAGLTVDIHTRFTNYVNGWLGGNVDFGDLFISTDGWNPFGTKPYDGDYAANGEAWEYALVLDDHESKSGGVASLYAVSQNNILLSDSTYGATHTYDYRSGQEVQLNTDGLSLIDTGSWDIIEDGVYDILRFNIDYQSDWGSASDLAFHWTMTCANDVIEGRVPEPSAFILILSGLFGISAILRKKRM